MCVTTVQHPTVILTSVLNLLLSYSDAFPTTATLLTSVDAVLGLVLSYIVSHSLVTKHTLLSGRAWSAGPGARVV